MGRFESALPAAGTGAPGALCRGGYPDQFATSARRRAEQTAQLSQERYALAQRAAKIGSWDWNLGTGEVHWSDEVHAMFGVPRADFKGTYAAFFERVHPDDRDGLAEAVRACIEQRKDFHVCYRIVLADAIRWVTGTGDVYRDRAGRPIRMLGVVEDMTARKALEQERHRLLAAEQAARNKVEASERRLALLAEVSQRLMSSLDYRVTLARVVQMIVPAQADGCVIYLLEDGDQIQRVAFKHVVAEKEALLRDLDQHYRLEFEAESPPATAFRTGMPQIGRDIASSVWKEVAQDGEHLRLLVALSPRSYMAVPLVSRGRVLGAMFLIVTESDVVYTDDDLAFAQDLARRAAVAIDNARLYREAQQARREAEAANRSKDEFLATVSHELRTPLNAILGWAVLLGKGSLSPATATRAIHSIERNARIQRQLIDDLLDLSRITSGLLRLEVREVDAGAVIDAALDAVRPLAEAKGLVLSRMFEPGIGPVSADPDRLQQIVWNLASNAVKFTERGGRIHMSLARRGSEVHISVVDSGQGIAADFLPHVFERFRQGDASPSRRRGGLGLGLAIVRHLVELHGGTVEASSPGLGQGATFTVRLPIQMAAIADRTGKAS